MLPFAFYENINDIALRHHELRVCNACRPTLNFPAVQRLLLPVNAADGVVSAEPKKRKRFHRRVAERISVFTSSIALTETTFDISTVSRARSLILVALVGPTMVCFSKSVNHAVSRVPW